MPAINISNLPLKCTSPAQISIKPLELSLTIRKNPSQISLAVDRSLYCAIMNDAKYFNEKHEQALNKQQYRFNDCNEPTLSDRMLMLNSNAAAMVNFLPIGLQKLNATQGHKFAIEVSQEMIKLADMQKGILETIPVGSRLHTEHTKNFSDINTISYELFLKTIQ
jgi:hypothetical protein